MAAVGLDLVEVSEVAASLERHGSRYVDRVYTAREAGRGHAPDPRRLAACFAAKEATIKVLAAPGVAIPWTAIELREPAATPRVELTGAAADLAHARGLGALHVSIAHASAHVLAVVVAR